LRHCIIAVLSKGGDEHFGAKLETHFDLALDALKKIG
jgi:hypothetical protein